MSDEPEPIEDDEQLVVVSCPECQTLMNREDDVYVCPECGFAGPVRD